MWAGDWSSLANATLPFPELDGTEDAVTQEMLFINNINYSTMQWIIQPYIFFVNFALVSGNMWAQDWSALANQTLPFPELDGTEDAVTQEMLRQGYTPRRMFQLADNFYGYVYVWL